MANLKIPQFPPLGRAPALGDLLLIWDAVLSKTTNVDVTALPYGEGGGGGSSTALGSPFKVRNTDANYAYVGGNTVITDPRLLGKSDYVVTTTQLNIEFEDAQMTCDPIAGSVTIANFQLQDGSHVTIYADGVTTTSAAEFYASLTATLTLYGQMLAPFVTTAYGANGGKVWWIGTPDTIPAGWQECVAMRGYVPVARDPADTFDATTNPDGASQPILTSGGHRMHTNSSAEMVPHNHTISTTNGRASNNDGADPVRGTDPGSVDVRGGTGAGTTIGMTGGADGAAVAYSIMNPYIIGMWIEFIGV